MSEKKNIYQRVNAVMNECEYIQKTKADKGVGVKYDEVIAMLRDLLIRNGIVVVVKQSEMLMLGGVEGTKQKVFQGLYTMDLVNMDKPDDRITHTTFAQGMDGGDKAPGKAQTYAVKIMLAKAFCIETGIDDESRSELAEKTKTISPDQSEILTSLINGNDAIWKRFTAAFKINTLDDLLASKFDEAKTKLEAANENIRKS